MRTGGNVSSNVNQQQPFRTGSLEQRKTPAKTSASDSTAGVDRSASMPEVPASGNPGLRRFARIGISAALAIGTPALLFSSLFGGQPNIQNGANFWQLNSESAHHPVPSEVVLERASRTACEKRYTTCDTYPEAVQTAEKNQGVQGAFSSVKTVEVVNKAGGDGFIQGIIHKVAGKEGSLAKVFGFQPQSPQGKLFQKLEAHFGRDQVLAAVITTKTEVPQGNHEAYVVHPLSALVDDAGLSGEPGAKGLYEAFRRNGSLGSFDTFRRAVLTEVNIAFAKDPSKLSAFGQNLLGFFPDQPLTALGWKQALKQKSTRVFCVPMRLTVPPPSVPAPLGLKPPGEVLLPPWTGGPMNPGVPSVTIPSPLPKGPLPMVDRGAEPAVAPSFNLVPPSIGGSKEGPSFTTKPREAAESVPEPSGILGVLAAGLFGWALKRNDRSK
jgi:hypothetical protein